MVFPHLSLSSSYPLRLDSLNKTVPSSIDGSSVERPLPFFLPLFKEKDRIFFAFYQQGFCDQEGNLQPYFNALKFPPLSTQSPLTSHSVKKLSNFFNHTHYLELKNFIDSTKVPINFFDLLKHLIEESYHPMENANDLTAFPIKDIKLIGSAALTFIQKEFLLDCAQKFFNELTEENKKSWQTSHFDHLFDRNAQDTDLRVLSSGDIHYQAQLSKLALNFISNSITNFNPSHCVRQLKSRNAKYKNLGETKDHHPFIKESVILESGVITKRHIINFDSNQFTILGIKPVREKPIDLLFVRLKEDGSPALKNLNLSSSNCWTLSLFSLFIENEKEWTLKIDTEPFTPAKALFDLFCRISTILDPTVDSWIRFLRDCERSMQLEIELKMVQNVYQHRDEFIQQHKVLSSLKEISNATYLFYLLEKEIKHIQSGQENPLLNSSTVTFFIFRACLSITKISSFSDQDCKELWQLVEHNKEENPSLISDVIGNPLASAIKIALIDENIPFSVVAAWIGLLAWGWAPLTATSHCQHPFFHLTDHFKCLLPIQPIKDFEVLQAYFLDHPRSSSFDLIFQHMTSIYQTSTLSFPLLPYFKQLNINEREIKKLAETWLQHASPVLKKIGLQIYLEILPLLNEKQLLEEIFQNLPQYLDCVSDPQQLIYDLNHLFSSISISYQEALQKIDLKKHSSLKEIDWLSILSQIKDPEILKIASFIWKNYKTTSEDKKKHQQIGSILYSSACACSPLLAFNLLKFFDTHQLFNSDQTKAHQILALIQSYRTYAAQQFTGIIDQILLFMDFIFKHDEGLKIQKNKQEFSNILIFFIQHLYRHSDYQEKADYFFLESSRRKYFSDFNWQTRMWLQKIEKLFSSSTPSANFIYSLYCLLSKEKLWDLSLEPSLSEKISVYLIQFLMKDPVKHSSILIQEFYHPVLFDSVKDESNQEKIDLFYQWKLFVFKNLIKGHFEDKDLKIFNHLLEEIPLTRQNESQHLFYCFFENFIKDNQENFFEKRNILPFFDRFLSQKKLLPLLILEDKKWKNLLLHYILKTHLIDYSIRHHDLWAIFEQIIQLFSQTSKNKALRLLLFKTLATLLKSISINDCFIEPHLELWIKNHQKEILETFYENQAVAESVTVMEFSHDKKNIEASLIPYLWWVCCSQNTLSSSTLSKFLDLSYFENLTSVIPSSDYSLLFAMIVKIADSPIASVDQIKKWLEWCLAIEKKGNYFNLLDLNDQCLKCTAQYIHKSEYNQSLNLLLLLSDLSSAHKDLYIQQLIKIINSSDSLSLVDTLKQFFNNKKNIKIDFKLCAPLIPVALEKIKNYLTSSNCTNSDIQFIIDFFSIYKIFDAKNWLALWKNLQQAQNANLICHAWKDFKTKHFNLKGTELDIAECWTSSLISLKQINHAELPDYFYNEKWLIHFKNFSLLDLKLQSLEAVFLGLIENLDLDSINYESLKFLYEKTDHLLTQCLQDYQAKINESLFKNIHDKDFPSFLVGLITTHTKGSIEFEKIEKLPKTFLFSLYKKLCVSTNCECLYFLTESICSFFGGNDSEKNSEIYHISTFYVQKAISSFVSLDGTATHHLYYAKMAEEIRLMIESICQADTIDFPFCYFLISQFVQFPNIVNIKHALDLTSKVLKLGIQDEMELSFKRDLLKLIDFILNEKFFPYSECIGKHHFDSIKEYIPFFDESETIKMLNHLHLIGIYLPTLLKTKNFTPLEKSELADLYLAKYHKERFPEENTPYHDTFMITYLDQNSCVLAPPLKLKDILDKLIYKNDLPAEKIDPANVVDIFNTYSLWMPYVFANPKSLKNILDRLVPIMVSYSYTSFKDPDNFALFQQLIKIILDVKLNASNFSDPIYDESLKYYWKWTIQSIKKSNPPPFELIKSLFIYIENLILQANSQNANTLVIQLIQEFAYLYASTSTHSSESESNPYQSSSHLKLSKNLIKQAHAKKTFEKYPLKLITLELWVGERFSTVFLDIHSHRLVFEKTIEKFLKFGSSQALTRACEACFQLQTWLTKPNHLKQNILIYQKLLKAIQSQLRCIIQYENKINNEVLFDYFDKQTRLTLPLSTLKDRQFFTEVSAIYFKFALENVKILINSPSDVFFQFHYLSRCFDLLKVQLTNGTFENEPLLYLSQLESFLPLIKKIEIEYHSHLNFKTDIFVLNPVDLMPRWFEALLDTPRTKNQTTISLKLNYKKKQRELLFKYLHLIASKESLKCTNKTYDHLLHSLIFLMNPENKVFAFLFDKQQEDARALAQLICTIIEEAELTTFTAKQLMLFEFFYLDFYMDELDKDYSTYLRHISCIVSLIPEIKLFQRKHIFPHFSENILSFITYTPNETSQDLLTKRKEIFLAFLTSIIPGCKNCFEEYELEAKTFLYKTLETGINNNFFYDNSHSLIIDQFKWTEEWLQDTDFIIPFTLLNYVFNFISLQKDIIAFLNQLNDLIHPLAKYIMKNCNNVISRQFVRIISYLPIPENDRFYLFMNWLNYFPEIAKTEYNPLIHSHLKELTAHIKEHKFFAKATVPAFTQNLNSKPGLLLPHSFIKDLIKDILEDAKK